MVDIKPFIIENDEEDEDINEEDEDINEEEIASGEESPEEKELNKIRIAIMSRYLIKGLNAYKETDKSYYTNDKCVSADGFLIIDKVANNEMKEIIKSYTSDLKISNLKTSRCKTKSVSLLVLGLLADDSLGSKRLPGIKKEAGGMDFLFENCVKLNQWMKKNNYKNATRVINKANFINSVIIEGKHKRILSTTFGALKKNRDINQSI
jgi:hypothetical protein